VVTSPAPLQTGQTCWLVVIADGFIPLPQQYEHLCCPENKIIISKPHYQL